MITSRQEPSNADQLWAGEIKLTVHVPKELTSSEEGQLRVSLTSLAAKFKAMAQVALPRGCRIDVEVG